MAVAKSNETIRQRMTPEEFLRLPNNGRKLELVDGEVKEVPTGFRHDRIVIHLARRLGPTADAYGYLTGSQAGFRMTDGNIRCPDLGFTRFERFPDDVLPEGFADFAPDLCIEIISPTEERADRERKIQEYFASGAKQVWQLFPETQTVIVYTSPQDRITYLPKEEIDGGDLLPDFRCRVAELFASPKKPSSP